MSHLSEMTDINDEIHHRLQFSIAFGPLKKKPKDQDQAQ